MSVSSAVSGAANLINSFSKKSNDPFAAEESIDDAQRKTRRSADDPEFEGKKQPIIDNKEGTEQSAKNATRGMKGKSLAEIEAEFLDDL